MTDSYIPMKSWAEDDQPREKLLKKGVASLSINELLAIILRSGKEGESALEISRKIMTGCHNDLNELARVTVSDLVKGYNGIGMAKAAGIVAALELGRRRMPESVKSAVYVRSSADVYQYIAPRIKDLDHEESWVIFLNRANKVQGCEKLSSGGWAGTTMDVRLLFKRALEMKSCAIIIIHNHPSGSLHPSENDKAMTLKIEEAGRVMDIKLRDHLIVGGSGYFSFIDEDLLTK